MTTEIVLAVRDVRKSAAWYEQLLGCRSSHGGEVFEILRNGEGQVILCLHQWGAHEHPTLAAPDGSPGNGMILYFKTSDLETIWNNALTLGAIIEEGIHHNPNSGQQEFSLRDPDHYYLSVSTQALHRDTDQVEGGILGQ